MLCFGVPTRVGLVTRLRRNRHSDTRSLIRTRTTARRLARPANRERVIAVEREPVNAPVGYADALGNLGDWHGGGE